MTGTDSTSTNLRVVFDASAKTSNNISLNDKLMVGPTIQKSLFSIILRFRKHSVAISADTYNSIRKMYRQALVNPKQRDLQKQIMAFFSR
jgi:hypothetical protein